MDPATQKYVFELLSRQFNINIDELTLETKLIEDLGADLLDIHEIIFDLENESDFEILFSDEMIERAKTVGDLIEQMTFDHQTRNHKGK